MRPDTRVYGFFDNENVSDYLRPDDTFTVTSTSRDTFDFNNIEDVPIRHQQIQQEHLMVNRLEHLVLVTSLRTKHTLQLI